MVFFAGMGEHLCDLGPEEREEEEMLSLLRVLGLQLLLLQLLQQQVCVKARVVQGTILLRRLLYSRHSALLAPPLAHRLERSTRRLQRTNLALWLPVVRVSLP